MSLMWFQAPKAHHNLRAPNIFCTSCFRNCSKSFYKNMKMEVMSKNDDTHCSYRLLCFDSHVCKFLEIQAQITNDRASNGKTNSYR